MRFFPIPARITWFLAALQAHTQPAVLLTWTKLKPSLFPTCYFAFLAITISTSRTVPHSLAVPLMGQRELGGR